MKPSTRILKEVDLNLNIISGNHKKHKPRRYNGHRPMSVDEWEAATPLLCPICNEETMRFIDGKCPRCARHVVERTERDMEKRATMNYYTKQLLEGKINLTQMKKMKKVHHLEAVHP